MSEAHRERGDLNGEFDTGYNRESNTRPAYFQHAFDLRAEWDAEVAGGSDHEVASRTIMYRDRDCECWYPYRPGHSPKEHLEESRMMQLEQERRDLQMRLAQMGEESSRDRLEIAKALRATTEATARFTTRWTYIAVGVAVVVLLLTTVGVVYNVLTYYKSSTP